MVNLLGTGGTDLRSVALDFEFWMGATSTGGAGIGIFGQVPCSISGGAALEGPAASQHGGIAKAALLLSFWFSKNTASTLHCTSMNLRLSMLLSLAANLYAVQHSNKNQGTSNLALNNLSSLDLKILVFFFFSQDIDNDDRYTPTHA